MSNILKPDRVRKIQFGGETLQINEKFIPDGARATKRIAAHVPQGGLVKPNKKLGLNNSGVPQGITIHNTEEIQTAATTNPAEQYTRATYPNGNMAGVVVHFYVWKKEIWQNLKLDEQGWHASDGSTRRASQRAGKTIGGNVDTISIEVIGNHAETEKTAAILTAWLCREYNFNPKLDVYTHKYFYAQKNCPVWLLPKWSAFLNSVANYVTSGGSTSAPVAFSPYLIKVISNPLNIRMRAGTNYPIAGVIKDNGVYTIVEEANGEGAKKWGKLKSGAGWISLDFTQKV